MAAQRYRVPTANGAVLAEPHFDAIPALVEANRKLLSNAPLRELRALARRELNISDAPLLLTGHQPELSHPGVWVKNFALNALARKLGGIPLHMVVDNDTLKNAALRFPVFRDRDPASVNVKSLAFDAFAREVPYEDRAVIDAELFRTFAERAAPLWANWGYEPLLAKCWSSGNHIGEAFTVMRRERERAWGCDNREVSVSRLSQTEAFALFARHILDDLPRFAGVYNAAVRAYRTANGLRSANHPVPLLAEGEAPFWVRTSDGQRLRATATTDIRTLRPRALTLTLFARLCLGEFFIHGIGGGKYDQVTDTIIRGYFGIEPPAYQVLSATLHLPLPAFPSTAGDLHEAQSRVRDAHWNPQKFLADDSTLVHEKQTLIASEPLRARRAWFRAITRINEELRGCVATQAEAARERLRCVQSEVAANAILQRRDYPWVLYPEAMLREFLVRFLCPQ